MDRIGRIEKSQLSSGLFPDQKLQTSPLWVDGSNVMFDADKISVFPGSLNLFTKNYSAVVTGILGINNLVTGYPAVLYGFPDRLKLWDATNGIQAVGSGYSSDSNDTHAVRATRWSFEQWNEWLVATNNKDPMQLLKIAGTGFVAMTANTSTQFKYAQIIRKFRQFLIAYNLTLADGTTKQPNAYAWCDVNDVETWVPTATNSARKGYIPDLEDGILCVERLGETHILYSLNSTYSMQYSGYPDVFQPQPGKKGIGVYGKNCVTEVMGKHVGYGPRGLWEFDGTEYSYIDTPPVRKYIADNINQSEISKVVLYNDRTIKHVLMFFPLMNDAENTVGIAWNYIENKFTKLGFYRSAAVDNGIFANSLTGDSVGNIFRQGLDEVPPSNPSTSVIPITSGGSIYTGFGEGGFGGRGFGGLLG